jgi:hypothetical protein
MTPDSLDKVAKLILDEYVAAKRAAYPNYNVNAKRHGQQLWRKVAMRVIDFGYDPVMYVRAVISTYGTTAYPNMMMTRDHDDIYRAYTAVDDDHSQNRVTSELARQTAYIKLRVEQGQPLDEILMDRANSFDSLFVWCMAMANGFPDLAARYADKAAEYMLRPIYREMYTKNFNTVDFGGIVND